MWCTEKNISLCSFLRKMHSWNLITRKHQINPNGRTDVLQSNWSVLFKSFTSLLCHVRTWQEDSHLQTRKQALTKCWCLNLGASVLWEMNFLIVSRKVSICGRTGKKKKKRKVSRPWRCPSKSWKPLQVNATSDPMGPGPRKRLSERTALRHLLKFSVDCA